jgi:hypothetical protein
LAEGLQTTLVMADEEDTVIVDGDRVRAPKPRPSILRVLVRFRLDEHETPNPQVLRRVEHFLEQALDGIWTDEEVTEPFARCGRLR